MKATEIRENMDAINNALSNLKRIYNDSETTGPERAKMRSKTYPGIARAMAEQWGGVCI